MVVTSDAVGLERAAARATMHERPLTILSNFDRDRLHRAAAGVTPIPRLVVQVTRPQASRAMVAMLRAKSAGFDRVFADDARE